jgi:NADH-quinone oxidoreductase subunit L
LILSVFTLGFWYCGSFTGQGIVYVPGVQNKEWFATLIEKPDHHQLENFKEKTRQPFGMVDEKPAIEFKKSTYDPAHGLSEEEAHHIHSIHTKGAIASIFIALFGIGFAFLMYIKKAISPDTFVKGFHGIYKTLKNKYYFDDLYIDVIIKKIILKFNDLLAAFDMGIWDKYGIDGWAKVSKFLFTWSGRFDDVVIDSVGVDGTGASVRFMNIILRTIQSGKIQFYFVVIILVVASYLLTLKLG